MDPAHDPATEPTLAELIRQRMAELDLTYPQVEERAEAAGEHVSKSTVWNLANEVPKRTPNRAVLEGLAAGLDLSLEEIWAALLRPLGWSVHRVIVEGEERLYLRRLDQGQGQGRERNSA
jgi:transcriptional regulator with XRE-family HTH domain